MILAALALALAPQDPAKLALLCLQPVTGEPPIRWLFTIEPAAGTFTATRNDTDPFDGVAAVTPDEIVLHRRGETLVSTMHISRRTGDITFANSSPKYPQIGTVYANGMCHKFTGNAF